MSRAPKKSGHNHAKKRTQAAQHPFFAKQLAIKNLSPDQWQAQFLAQYERGAYEQALQTALDFVKQHPRIASVWTDAATCAVYLQKWDVAIDCCQRALALDPDLLAAYDGLAHAYGAQGETDHTRQYGLTAFTMRHQRFGLRAPFAWDVSALSKPEIAGERIIAFSLFGSDSKYCETAVLNVIEQKRVYPDWRCRFYVDDSVPEFILSRLREHGAQIMLVDDEVKTWPGAMWRFAAYDDPNVSRVIFRDADSVVSKREALAVEDWVCSQQPFHMMRDAGSHTELVLAGLWGCVRGALPPMSQMVGDYLTKTSPDERFADQYFLREYVWPYMRDHVVQHDSKFGFLNARAFPLEAQAGERSIGDAEGITFFDAPVNAPDGTTVYWSLWHHVDGAEQQICRYPAVVQNNTIRAHIPRRYTQKLNREYLLKVQCPT